GDHAIRAQVFKIFAEGLDSVEIVFAESEGARGGRSPRVDQGHLHHVKLLVGRAQIGSAVGHVQVHVGALVKMFGVSGVSPAHDGVGDDGIDLDRGYARAARVEGAQNVDAAARTDDGIVSVRPYDVRQRRRPGHKNAVPGSAGHALRFNIHDVGGSVGV